MDAVIPEPDGGAHADYDETAARLRDALLENLARLDALSPDELRQERWEKFERMGEWRVVPAKA